MLVSIQQSIGKLLISYVNKEGKISFSCINVPPEQRYTYVYARGGKHDATVKSWDNKPVIKVPSEFLNRYRLQEFFIDAGEEICSKFFENNIPDLYSCDIEVDVTDDGFPEATNANNRINTISWCRYPNIIVFGLKPLTGDQCVDIENKINKHIEKTKKKYKFVYKQFDNEANMLYDFLYNYLRHAPLITGWNFWTYDWLYIVNRARKLNMDISWVSPTKQWKQYKFESRNEKIPVMLPQHKLIVDYMSVYEKWDRTIDTKENSSLDFVAESALGIKKVKYPGTLQDLYSKDFDQYVYYNAIDSVLVELIHEKIKTMNMFLGLGNITKVEAMDAFSPICMLESTLARYAYKRNLVFPKTIKNQEQQEYEGGFVFQPEPDIYDWVASLDYQSLYPKIMMQWKISIENFIKKDKDYKPKEKEIKCVNGSVFSYEREPLIPEILSDYFNLRKQNKGISLKAEKESAELKKILKERLSNTNTALS